jgi:uncharacterized protein YdaU (DUF1376 family)
MNGLPYYKAYPRDFFEGTIGLDFEEKAAYRLVLDLIYMHGGRLADDPRFIAGHLGCSVKKWNALRSALLATGKITASEGYLGNLRADKELDSLKSMQGKQRENASKPKKNNTVAKAMAEPKASHTEPEPDKKQQQPREEVPSSKADLTDRERLLAAMGADPISGQIGPNGRRLGTVADTEEAAKWSAMGLTVERQCAVIAERCAAMRKNNPHWTPGRFAYFSGAMSDLVAARSAKPSAGGSAPSDRDAKLRQYARIAGRPA